jgi:hypothetical protein
MDRPEVWAGLVASFGHGRLEETRPPPRQGRLGPPSDSESPPAASQLGRKREGARVQRRPRRAGGVHANGQPFPSEPQWPGGSSHATERLRPRRRRSCWQSKPRRAVLCALRLRLQLEARHLEGRSLWHHAMTLSFVIWKVREQGALLRPRHSAPRRFAQRPSYGACIDHDPDLPYSSSKNAARSSRL